MRESDRDGLLIAVRVTPRGGRDSIDGWSTDENGRPVLRVRLAAPPVEGAANAALTAFLAKQLGLRKSAVTIRSGETARLKLVHLQGEAEALAAALSSSAGSPAPPQ